MSAKRRPKFRPGLDNLDDRILLSATYSLTNGNLYETLSGQTTLVDSHVTSFQVTSADAVVYLENTGNLFDKAATGNPQLLDRLVSSFQVESATQVNVVDWFDSHLKDTGIVNTTRSEFTRDDAITFGDMLGIFNEVLQGGAVSGTQAKDLQTVVAGANVLNMPGYVADLAGKVVNPSSTDVAYLEWRYGDGSTPTSLLPALVNQWFNGTVQPDTYDAEEGSAPMDPYGVYTPVGATGYTLFGPGGPSYADVCQGSLGDCWYLSSLAATAARYPQIIQNMFISNSNGTWTVRFYHDGVPDYVTVNDQLPVSTTNPAFDGGYAFDQPLNGVLWVALAEKAYAEENLSGFVTTQYPGSYSYASMAGGYPVWAMAAIAGVSATQYNVVPGTTASEIATAMEDGDLVCLTTPSSGIDSHLITAHCYAVVGYDPSSPYPFKVFNPWGLAVYQDSGGQTYGLFGANGGFLEQNFVAWGVAGTAAPGSGPGAAMPTGGAAGSTPIGASDELASLLTDTGASGQARTGTGVAIRTGNIDASTGQPIVIGLAPTSPAQSISQQHDHLDHALGSLMDDDLTFLRS
jgi:hypothetical protein